MGAAEKKPAYTLTVDELEAIVEKAVAKALASNSNGAHEFMTAAQLAQAIGQTPHNIRRLARKEGMPHVLAGSDYRFVLNDVKQWMDERAKRKHSK